MILDRHWWNTTDGRLVADGHADAAILAYPKGTEIPDEVARRLGILTDAQPAAKAMSAPPNKAGRRPADK